MISCIGPYQGQSLNLLRACTEKYIAYVDVADDRDFVERCHHMAPLIEAAGIPAFVGCSVVPGMSSLLTRYGQKEISSIESTRIFISPGTQSPRGPGSFLCLLSTVGNEFPIPSGSYQRRVRGWTGRERVCFPSPMGHRWVYFVVDVADYFLQPIYFGVKNVEFKIGSELDLLNRTLSGLRQFKGALNLKNIDCLMPMSRALIYAASLFGTSQGGVMVEVSGKSNGGERTTMWLSVLSGENGQVIPALLPSLAAQMLLRGEVTCRGIVPLPDWLSRQKFVEELSKRRLKMAEKTEGIWMACN